VRGFRVTQPLCSKLATKRSIIILQRAGRSPSTPMPWQLQTAEMAEMTRPVVMMAPNVKPRIFSRQLSPKNRSISAQIASLKKSRLHSKFILSSLDQTPTSQDVSIIRLAKKKSQI
jgi:hypothetical protein